jgi:microcystin-dependent protein
VPTSNRKSDVSDFLDIGDAPSNKKANITVNADGSMILGINASFKAYSGADKDVLINPIDSTSLAGQLIVFCNSSAGINNLAQGEIGVLMVTPGTVAKGDVISDDFTVLGGGGGGGGNIGDIIAYGGNVAPAGFLVCDGSAVSRTTYDDLFTSIGVSYGVGDGSTTFNLPDLRSAVPVGSGTSTQFTQNETRVLGTAYDDQMQQITGNFGAGRMFASGTGLTASGALSRGTAPSYSLPESVASSGTDQAISFDSANSPNARTGTNTHGKQVGVNYIIRYAGGFSAGDITLEAGAVQTGTIAPFGGTTPPSGYLLCDGTAYNRTTYSDLFNVIGTTFGVGDGSTTFNVPDLRSAVPVGAGTSTQFTQNETKVAGTAYDDKMQGHWHELVVEFSVVSGQVYSEGSASTNDATLTQAVQNPITDGVNGTPRTGDSTHGKQVGVNYIIKYTNATSITTTIVRTDIYDQETDYDISATSYSIDLTTFFGQDDGWIESWSWHSGDGSDTIDWNNGTYTGKTIGGVTANTLTANLKGEGTGRITLKKDGNNAKILTQGTYDHDGQQFGSQSWEKTPSGKVEFWDAETYNVAISTSSGNIKVTSSDLTPPTFSITPASSIIRNTFLIDDGASPIVSWVVSGGTSAGPTVGWEPFRLADSLNSIAVDREVGFYAKGRWTTSYPRIG